MLSSGHVTGDHLGALARIYPKALEDVCADAEVALDLSTSVGLQRRQNDRSLHDFDGI